MYNYLHLNVSLHLSICLIYILNKAVKFSAVYILKDKLFFGSQL